MSIKHIGNLDDVDIEAALNGFVHNAMPLESDVTVQFASGVASLRGTVHSLTVAQAIEDLVLAHEGVESVINDLTLAPVATRIEESRPSA